VAVKAEPNAGEQIVETRDVSSGGVFFELPSSLTVGSPVEFLMTLPEPITKGSPVRIRCIGKVVRVEKNAPAAAGNLGVAATIERYEFIRNV
jgi:hypothetical protein